MEHVKDLLSSYIDGKLPAAEASAVDAHVGRCEDCRRELADLRSLTKLLASAPKEPLPTGFAQRLENRRRREEAAEAEKPKSFLPYPARLAAFGMSAAVVCLVAYDALKGPGRMAERMAEIDALAGADPQDTFRPVPQGVARLAAPAAPASQGLEAGGAAGRFFGGLAGAGSSVEAASAAPQKKEARAAGAPIGVEERPEPKAYTNEELYAHLDAERKKMGITEIVPPGADEQPARRRVRTAPVPEEANPMSAAEARQYMRQMAADIARQRMAMGISPDPVAIGEGTKPKLFDKAQEPVAAGSAIGDDRTAARKDDASARGGDVQASAGIAQAPTYAKRYESPEAAASRARGELGKSKSLAAARGAAGARAPSAAASLGAKGAESLASDEASAAEPAAPAAAPADGPSAHAARSPEELRALWAKLGKSGALPSVDFNAEMVVAVSAPTAIEIVSVWETRRAVVIQCRRDPDRREAGSAFRVVTKSEKPIEIKLVR